MDRLIKASLGDLRAIAHALCENDDKLKNEFVSFISSTGEDSDEVLDADPVVVIQHATAQELLSTEMYFYDDKKIKKRIDNFLQVLRYFKPTEVATDVVDPSNPLKNATAKELQNVMFALCEDEDAKRRFNNHLRVLRRSKLNGAAFAKHNPDALVTCNSPTETELRAIGLAMSDGDEGIKKRLLESLHALSIFGKLQASEPQDGPFQCLRCKTLYFEQNNTSRSCIYHPGKLSTFIPVRGFFSLVVVTGQLEKEILDKIPMSFGLWSCCARDGFEGGCTLQKHCHN